MKIEVKGLKELDESLARLGPVAGAKAMRSAMFAASKPILDQAKANIHKWPRGSGALYQAMGRVFIVGGGSSFFSELASAGNKFTVQIGPRRKVAPAIALYNLHYTPKRKKKGIYHGHFQEFGTSRQSPRPFLKPALDTAGQRAVSEFSEQLRKRINRALKKQDPSAQTV